MDGSPSAVPSSDAGAPSAAVSNRGRLESRRRWLSLLHHHLRARCIPIHPTSTPHQPSHHHSPTSAVTGSPLLTHHHCWLLCPCSHSTRRSRSGSGVVTTVAALADPMMLEAHVQHGSLSAAPNMASSSAAGAFFDCHELMASSLCRLCHRLLHHHWPHHCPPCLPLCHHTFTRVTTWPLACCPFIPHNLCPFIPPYHASRHVRHHHTSPPPPPLPAPFAVSSTAVGNSMLHLAAPPHCSTAIPAHSPLSLSLHHHRHTSTLQVCHLRCDHT